MKELYTINHFNLGLPEGPDKGNVVKLLNHLAKNIDASEEIASIQDIVFHNDLDEDGNDWPHFTVYYHTLEEL